jgi:RimJ/RimL family protein N-acetyltransferase
MVLSGDQSQTLITSARLALRAFKGADAAESFEEASAAIAQFMSWNPRASEREFETVWQGRLSQMKAGTELHLVIRLNSTDEFVGAAGGIRRTARCWKPEYGSRSRRKVMDMGEKLLPP